MSRGGRPPWAETPEDEAFDDRFAGLRIVEPPSALVERTLRAVEQARGTESGAPRLPPTVRRGSSPAFRTLAAVGGFAMAALGLWSVTPSAPVGDPTALVPRGDGVAQASVELRAAVRSGDGAGAPVARFEPGTRYRAGDTLLFRVRASAPMNARLFRDDRLLWSGALPEGETDLPVGYAFEPGEPAARFHLEAALRDPSGDVAGPAPAGLDVAAVAP